MEPGSNNSVALWPERQTYSAGSATAACFVIMSCTSPGLNATSQAQRPKPPAALIAFVQGGRWVEAERRLAETPPLLKTPAGYVQVSPWITISNRQVELMTRLMAELGLTPSARSRLAIQLPNGPKPWEFADRWAEEG